MSNIIDDHDLGYELLELIRQEIFPGEQYNYVHKVWLNCIDDRISLIFNTNDKEIIMYKDFTTRLGSWSIYDASMIDHIKNIMVNLRSIRHC